MTADYGSRARGAARAPLVIFGAALALAAAIVGAVEVHLLALKRTANLAAASQWEVTGPPCPSLTAREFLQRKLKTPQAFAYDDLVIGRAFGHVSCGAAGNDHGRSVFTHPVCQFTGPGALRVQTPKGEFFFAPGPGRPATLSVEHGTPACVLASHFTL